MAPTVEESEDSRPPQGWGVGLRVWMERAGRSVLGPEQLRVLEAVDCHRSISAAARTIGIPYRRAWELVRDMNEAAGAPLVTTATGGLDGGGARLTTLGGWAMAAYRHSEGRLSVAAAGLVPRITLPPAPGLHVAAAVSLEEVLGQLIVDFAEVEPALTVRAVFGASDELADYLLAGAPGHLFLTADPVPLERLQAGGLLRAGRPVPLAENGLAAVTAAPAGLAVRTPADLGRDVAGRVAIARPDCPLGRYTEAYLVARGLHERVMRRAVPVENSRAVLTAVRARQAEVGIVYASDAARADGCRTLFRVRRPPVPVRYSGAVVRSGGDAGPARRFLEFLGSPRARRRFRRAGFFVPSTQS